MSEIIKQDGIKTLMSNDIVKAKFTEILGKNANAFISSVTTLATTTALKDCEPKSILSCAITAASLNLQVNPSLGFSAIVPYKSKNGLVAQFQIMWKGLWQLAIRSGQFKYVNVTEVYEGELASENRMTGAIDLTGEKKNDKIVGYCAYFELTNGFQKSMFMTIDQIKKHGAKYSKTFKNEYGVWNTNFEAMAAKTVLKLLLARYAPLSVEMQTAISSDQSIITTNDELEITDFTYVDNEENKEPDIEVKAIRKEQKLFENETENK